MDTPDLRRRGYISRLIRVLERHADKEKCDSHCRCVERMRVKVGVLMAVFLLLVGALVRREVLSYEPRTPAALPPIRSGYVLPGVDDTKGSANAVNPGQD